MMVRGKESTKCLSFPRTVGLKMEVQPRKLCTKKRQRTNKTDPSKAWNLFDSFDMLSLECVSVFSFVKGFVLLCLTSAPDVTHR